MDIAGPESPAPHPLRPCRRLAPRSVRLVSAIIVIGAVLSMVDPSSASGDPAKRHFRRMGFSTNCLWVRARSGWDVWGGVNGAERRGRRGSSCLRPGYDRSIVLATEMRIDGHAITPNAVYVYTVVPNHERGTPNAPPAGLKLTGTALQWQCGPGTPRTNKPYRCRPGQRTLAWITMPACWNGGSRVIYGICRPGYIQLPVWQLEFAWPVIDARRATFTGGGKFHASWQNGWKVSAMTSLVTHCIVKPSPCGSVVNYFHDHPLGK